MEGVSRKRPLVRARPVALLLPVAAARTIVVGYNKGWKQGVRLGRRTNQGFVQVPFHTLVRQITYKAEEHGIAVVLQDESYTSRCSFLDGEPVERHEHYQGRRTRRGLFVAGTAALSTLT